MNKSKRSLSLSIILVFILTSILTFDVNPTYGAQKISTPTNDQSNISSQIKGKPTYPKDNKAPLMPTGLTAISGNQSATLSWDANQEIDLDCYQLEYRTANSKWTQITLTKADTSYIVKNLINEIAYQFRIKAKDIYGNWSHYSGTIYVTPLAVAPVPSVTNLTFSNVNNIPYLNWTNPITDEIATLKFLVSTDGITWDFFGDMPFDQNVNQLIMADIIFKFVSLRGESNLSYYFQVESVPKSENKPASFAISEGKLLVDIYGVGPEPSFATYNASSCSVGGLNPDPLYIIFAHFWDNNHTLSGGIGSSDGTFILEIPSYVDPQSDTFRWKVTLREIFRLEIQGNDIVWSMSQLTETYLSEENAIQ